MSSRTKPQPQPNPDDSELLHCCAEYHRIRATVAQFPDDGDIEMFCRILRILSALSDYVMALPHRTDEGRRAKAGVAICQLADGIHPAM